MFETTEDLQAAEVKALADYGLDEGAARRLIEDVREAGGIDRFLRLRTTEED